MFDVLNRTGEPRTRSSLRFFESFQADHDLRGADRAMLLELDTAATNWLVQHICKIDIQVARSRRGHSGPFERRS